MTKILIVGVLFLVAGFMIVFGIWSLYDANRKKPDLPLLFRWAQKGNQTMGTFFGVFMAGGGVFIAVMAIRVLMADG